MNTVQKQSMITNATLRKVTAQDIIALQEISRVTFIETFADKNTAEDMQKYLEEVFSLDAISREVSNPETEFYFAWYENRVIGYLKLNFGGAQTERDDQDAVEIERIYIRKEFHGKQFGLFLLGKAIEIAQAKKAPYIWLGVWEHNTRALAFYRKNGFIEYGKHGFQLGDDLQTDILMKKILN